MRRSATAEAREDRGETSASLEVIAEQNRIILLQNKLTRLERDWEKQQREICLVDRYGNPITPSLPAARWFAGLGVVLLGGAGLAHAGVFPPGYAPLVLALGLLLGALFLFLAVLLSLNAGRYGKALKRYERRRLDLEQQLAALE